MLRNDFYRMLKSVLDADQFLEDDIRSIVRIRLPLKIEDVKDLKLCILQMFGNFHVPFIDPHKNMHKAGYKFDSHWIDYDKVTIDVNERGKLCAKPEILADQLINDPNKWGPFLEGLFAAIMNDPSSLHYFIKLIKKDTVFIEELKQAVIDEVKNDPAFISSIVSAIESPFDINNLVGRWKTPNVDIIFEMDNLHSWTLIGTGNEASLNISGDGAEALDNKDFVLVNTYFHNSIVDIPRCSGKYYTNRILLTVTPQTTDVNQKMTSLLMEKLP